MSGNAGTNPATQCIGTSDNKDVVFKSNGTERFRLLSNGDIKLFGTATGTGPLYRDGNGVMKMGGFEDLPVYPCALDLRAHPYWKTTGNAFPTLCPEVAGPRLGTRNNFPLSFITNDQVRMMVFRYGTDLGTSLGFNIDAGGHVGILTEAEAGIPLSIMHGQGDYIRFKRSADAGAGYWAIHNGDATENHLAFHFFPDNAPALLNRLVLWNNGKVSIGGAVPGADPLYNLYVEGGIATRDVRVTAGNFPDFVFQPGYRLLPLDEVNRFIQLNGHLPNFPSAEEVAQNKGVEVGDMQLRLLKTLEEQQLYILQLKDEIDGLNLRIRSLEMK
jgi:hypothetical protein